MSEEEAVSAPVDSRRAPPPLTSNNKWIDDGRRCHHDNINIDRPRRRALLSELASFVCCTVVFVVCCPCIAATKADSAQDQPDGSKVLTGYEDIGIASLCGRFSRKDISGSSSRISADRRSRRDVGCLGKSFLKQRDLSQSPEDQSAWPKAYEIDFEATPFQGRSEEVDGGGGGGGSHLLPPEICRKTCQLVYPNTSLALVTLVNGLSCYCAVGDSLSSELLGPSGFCDHECGSSSSNDDGPGSPSSFCGGEHTFRDGAREEFASIYCVQEPESKRVLFRTLSSSTVASPTAQKMNLMNLVVGSLLRSSNETTVSGGGDVGSGANGSSSSSSLQREEVEELLNDIWLTLVKTNIVSIVMIGLLVMLVILVIVLLVWAYLFMENYDQHAQSNFYRTLSARGPRQQPLGGGSGGDGVPGYGSTNQAFEPGPGGPNAQGSSSSATSAPELFAASDDKAVGNSTFLGGGGDAGEDDISQSSADTEMADQNGNGRSAS